jgi:hypothetical protein
MHIDVWVLEALLYLLGAGCFLVGRSIYGSRETGLFFLGVVILAGFNEHVTCFLGKYNYLWHLSRDVGYFSNYAQSLGGNWVWIGVLPGYFFPGWFSGCLCSYTITRVLFPNASTVLRAIVTSLQVIIVGLVVENLGQINHWWEYTSQGKTLIFWDGVWGGVFIYYLCWIGSLVLVFERTVLEKKDFGFLRAIEKRACKTSPLGTYCFRLFVFSILSAIVTHLFDWIVLQPFAA